MSNRDYFVAFLCLKRKGPISRTTFSDNGESFNKFKANCVAFGHVVDKDFHLRFSVTNYRFSLALHNDGET